MGGMDVEIKRKKKKGGQGWRAVMANNRECESERYIIIPRHFCLCSV
jgi:hypothetical protein